MTPEELQQMIKAGDAQACHVVHEGLHYFKFGSFWLVEDEGPVAQRVYDPYLSRQLDTQKADLGKAPPPEIRLAPMTFEEVKDLSFEEICNMPVKSFRWTCCYPGCRNFAILWCVGVWPLLYYPASWKRSDPWVNVHEKYRLCSRHYPMYKRRQIDPDILNKELPAQNYHKSNF